MASAGGVPGRARSARATTFRIACLAAGLALGISLAPSVRADETDAAGQEGPVIYKWVDEEGIAHFTADPERVPENVRSLIRKEAEQERRDRQEPEGTPPEAAAPARDRAEHWAEMEAAPSDAAEGPEARDISQGAAPETGARAARPSAALRAQRAELEQRIHELEAQIARDEERIKELLSRPREQAQPPGEGGEAAPVAGPELREVAMRLPRLQEELRELRERRAQLEAR